MKAECNRTYARFVHNDKQYTIHERSNKLSNGQWYIRRFIADENDQWQGWASNVRQARKVLDGVDKHRFTGQQDELSKYIDARVG